ncbi:MAG: bifunctional 2-polyprenyl-6-hydroxyphenol methylase/3-demethylubiquinol 3-O-methyltransferase UbiG [Azospirillaceae bacterium]|nr:bifunctional 2-polyprenyl-6-hydroxyphenol methylase/3-demethylubiquinol 3-O-methyltransferase UbiG [Azospirillaceae bacterium]
MSQTATTVDPGEIQRFSAIAAEWWDEAGKFRPLHKLNPVRLEYIRDRVCAHFGRDPLAPYPLKGLRLVDIGCGGGLLSEPLARMGATVVGIDAAERNVKTAATHAAETGTQVDYRHTTAEDLVAAGERFDAVLSLEVVEHVADVPLFLQSLAALMKPEGLVVMATLNRTPKSYLMAIVGAEYVLRWLPRGTHDWHKFLKPSELTAGLRATGLTVQEVMGLTYSPLSDRFRLDPRDLDVNYLLWASGH